MSGQYATIVADLISPVIAGPHFSDLDGDRGGVLRMELPLSSAEMAAALYDSAGISFQDLATAEDLWQEVAVTVACSGLGAVRDRASELADPGNVAAPDWLRFCRERVAATISQRNAAIGPDDDGPAFCHVFTETRLGGNDRLRATPCRLADWESQP